MASGQRGRGATGGGIGRPWAVIALLIGVLAACGPVAAPTPTVPPLAPSATAIGAAAAPTPTPSRAVTPTRAGTPTPTATPTRLATTPTRGPTPAGALPPSVRTTATAAAIVSGTAVATVTGRQGQPGPVRDALGRLEAHESFRLTMSGVYLREDAPPVRIVVEKHGAVRRGMYEGLPIGSQEAYQTEEGVFSVTNGTLQKIGETPILTNIPALVYATIITRHLDWRDEGPVVVDGRPARRWVGEGTLDDSLAGSPGPGIPGPARSGVLVAEADGVLSRASIRFGVGVGREEELRMEVADVDAVPPIVVPGQ